MWDLSYPQWTPLLQISLYNPAMCGQRLTRHSSAHRRRPGQRTLPLSGSPSTASSFCLPGSWFPELVLSLDNGLTFSILFGHGLYYFTGFFHLFLLRTLNCLLKSKPNFGLLGHRFTWPGFRERGRKNIIITLDLAGYKYVPWYFTSSRYVYIYI